MSTLNGLTAASQSIANSMAATTRERISTRDAFAATCNRNTAGLEPEPPIREGDHTKELKYGRDGWTEIFYK